MAHILIIVSDAPDGVTVTVEHAPKPAAEPTPAQRVAASIFIHLVDAFKADEEIDTP